MLVSGKKSRHSFEVISERTKMPISIEEDKVKVLLFHGEKMIQEWKQNVELSKA